MSTHIHFVIACIIFEFLICLIYRKSPTKRQIFGLIFLPISSYYFIYERPLLPVLGILQPYLTTLICLAFTIFLNTLSFESLIVKKTNKKYLVFIPITSFILISLMYGVPYLIRSLPTHNPEAVLFSLFQNNTGTENFLFYMIWNNVFYPAFKTFLILNLILFAFALAIHLSKRTWVFSFFSFKIRFYYCKKILGTLEKILLVSFVVILCFFFSSIPQLISPLREIYNAYSLSNKKVNSAFYLDEYIFPDSVSISFPKEKKNLIYIMMESMETNFHKFTPEINMLTQNNISFQPGGSDVAYTGWTIAAQVSKFCGIPLKLPLGLENSNYILSYLPHAKCLTDILAENDYKQVYVQGSDGTFASKRNFWNQHKVTNFYDFPHYKKIGRVSSQRENLAWGLSDETLFKLVKEELTKVTKDTNNPFAIYTITVDTHFPNGFLSPSCQKPENSSMQYPSVLKCASSQINEFLNWAKKQDWYKNTVIVIVGDHTWSTFTELLNIPKDEQLNWVNIFINSQIQPSKINREFSSFDMYPTTLEAMGAEIQGHRLGLGASLFSAEKTLLEKYKKKDLDSILSIKSYQYDYFMQGGSFNRE